MPVAVDLRYVVVAKKGALLRQGLRLDSPAIGELAAGTRCHASMPLHSMHVCRSFSFDAMSRALICSHTGPNSKRSVIPWLAQYDMQYQA